MTDDQASYDYLGIGRLGYTYITEAYKTDFENLAIHLFFLQCNLNYSEINYMILKKQSTIFK